ncbi:MAG: ABC transporter ATP-binding protein [Pusillimonas sp.]
MTTAPVLAASGLSKRFGGFYAVDNVSIEVREGSIHALIGPNGAGKTTCFNLLTKFMAPDAGRIMYRGKDITGFSPEEVARLGIVRSFQISAVFLGMSATQNVRVALMRRDGLGSCFWRSKRLLDHLDERAQELLAAVGLAADRNTLAASLPYGRKRALEIAMTLALEPDMMLLDEPMAGLGQEDVERISDLIKQVSANRTILMVEHNLSVVAQLSDTITVLARGAVLAEGDYATVSRDERVITAYMGSDEEEHDDAVH